MELDGSVESLLSDVLQIPQDRITDTLAMTDVDAWDSLKHMELIASLEQTFAIELSFDEIVTMRSVAEIKRVLRDKAVNA